MRYLETQRDQDKVDHQLVCSELQTTIEALRQTRNLQIKAKTDQDEAELEVKAQQDSLDKLLLKLDQEKYHLQEQTTKTIDQVSQLVIASMVPYLYFPG